MTAPATVTPACPLHGPMMLVHVTQGEGKEETDLGYVWFCVNNDEGKPDEYCDNCEDYIPEPVQMELL
jgi:hypothetical protein